MKAKHLIFLIVLYTNTLFVFTQTTETSAHTNNQAQSTATQENMQNQEPSVISRLVSPQQKKDALKLYTSGKYAESINVCQEEIAVNPKRVDSYVVMSWALVANKEYAEAEYWASEALKFAKYDQRLIEVLAEARFFLGKNDESLELFQEYISIVPVNGSRIADAYYFMGEIYIRKGMYDHADISFSQAVRTDPLYDYWWTRLGYAREMAGYYRTAFTAYEKSLQLNSSQADALRGRDRVKAKLQ
ncbi:MAG TPA: tetratricopeptide repeat protein [Treponemataceae bacterium]|nr:tetratricopeptide repeat protein [Treponemataceae bacterium]